MKKVHSKSSKKKNGNAKKKTNVLVKQDASKSVKKSKAVENKKENSFFKQIPSILASFFKRIYSAFAAFFKKIGSALARKRTDAEKKSKNSFFKGLFSKFVKKSADVEEKTAKTHESYNVLNFGASQEIAIEAYRRLYANILYLPLESRCRKIVFTSATSNEGKTTVATNLAITLAQTLNSAKILLIDTDMRKPGIEQMMPADFQEKGLSEFLMGVDEEPNIVSSSVDGLYMLYSGNYPENPTRLISSERMAALFRHCEERFDYILLDTPSLDAGSEAILLKKHVDGYVFVAKSKNSDVESLGKAMDSLRSLGATIFGMVLMGEKVKKHKPIKFNFRKK